MSSTTVNTVEMIPKKETLRLRNTYIGKNISLFFKKNPLKIIKGKGQYMYDEEGNQYLDCINNVAHVGHSHPHVTRAGCEQMSLLSTNCRYLHDNIVLYAKRLTATFPNKLSVCYFVNSGSEANDLAIRLARAYTKHEDVITIESAYHGHLTTTMDISPYKFEKMNNTKKKDWVHVAPLPCSYRGKYTTDSYNESEIGELYAQDVQKILNNVHNNGRNVAAFIIESMVSCGGQVVLPSGYLRNRKRLRYVRQAGGVCIADEVQVGFGRVGSSMWAYQLQGNDVVPDIVTLGKPIGNGYPVAAVVTTPEIADAFAALGVDYFNTYGGNPVSMAIANAVLDVIEDENLMENATKIGSYLLTSLEALKRKFKIIGDIRGKGMFIGIDLIKDANKTPAIEEAAYILSRLKDEKIIMSTDGKYDNVLKFKPPMVFDLENAKHLVSTLETIFREVDCDDWINNSVSSHGSSGGDSLDGSLD
ncbi:Alanine--glyoxylate aminotransferase 2-like 1 [Leptotrombidium deliense]|uniref:Alanine--glyoxylate aminotransferase 2-like 1 n=1 Tax=Leptotrombidium deliense TaxID=299467 RepID=A0A443STI3_9ACAR|nr:Alanine--glyoxylate aminotransferase 2-like 1 [Leptotrombidium deliense]